MRILRFQDPMGHTHYGSPADDRHADLLEGDLFTGLRPTNQRLTIGKLLAPLAPANIFCIGLNYRGHARETNAAIPEIPVIFMKPTSAVTAPASPIRIPACCTRGPEVDYEGELAVVIGKPARDVPAERAMDYVLGCTAAIDVSARKWQKNSGGGQWIRGKSFDTFCPLGPVLVTKDELADPQSLRLTTTINGQTMQDSTTSDMIFPIAQLIAFLSQDTTLLPGTVILTGTPQGVGFVRQPPVFLKPGDTVTVEIEKIGRLTCPVA
ncbi:MAG: fumarylacetoacetate hydrolase family protein [Phycisphaeraceae bacterium]|nr:fumarylacetoacetate hydrolase family protein [Phycisphaeraceae bacterium]